MDISSKIQHQVFMLLQYNNTKLRIILSTNRSMFLKYLCMIKLLLQLFG
jgi:hypothetical protein